MCSVSRWSCWFAGVFFSVVISVPAQNLLQNGNFEEDGGSFAGWTVNPSETDLYSANPAIASDGINDGYYARFTYDPNGPDTLSQTLSTIPGTIYDVAFSVEDGSGHNFETELTFGNSTDDLAPTFETGPGDYLEGWTNLNFDFTATSPETELSFTVLADTGSEFGVDNVSAMPEPAPEPASSICLVSGIVGLLLTRFSYCHRNSRPSQCLRPPRPGQGDLPK